MNQSFDQQELHLIYNELKQMQYQLTESIYQKEQNGRQHINEMTHDIRLNLDSISDSLATYATIEAMNRQIDQYNFQLDSAQTELAKVNRLLPSPYFGQITVTFLEDHVKESFNIGINGFTNEEGTTRIFDWRSPIAELFYQNQIGATSYSVNTQKILVDLQKRRQFITEYDHLVAAFDTETAIQDDVLLQALTKDHSQMMSDITSTIQKEQNSIIREQSSTHLLVHGVAGSGKTSTLLQRLAYLLYRKRQELDASNLLILSPNESFGSYISHVLPTLGEENPAILTFRQLVQQLTHSSNPVEDEEMYFQRIQKKKESYQEHVLRNQSFLSFIAQKVDTLSLNFTDIQLKKKVFISKELVLSFFEQTPTHAPLIERLAATKEKLLSYWENRLKKQAYSKKLLDQLQSSTEEQQKKWFNRLLTTGDEENLPSLVEKILRKKYRKIQQKIEQFFWVETEELLPLLYQSFTNKPFIHSEYKTVDELVIRCFIYRSFIQKSSIPEYKIIVIDEVQDYTASQIQLLRLCWPQADFMVVGDENQAIFNSTLTFSELETIFQHQTKTYTLPTSYRSTGAITHLFGTLATSTIPFEVVAVRPEGKPVTFVNYTDTNEEVDQLSSLISEDKNWVLLTKDIAHVEQLQKTVLAKLPIKILSIAQAKGLEFPYVILHNVSEYEYHDTEDQRLLYTGISRATQELIITYNKQLSRLLPNEEYQ